MRRSYALRRVVPAVLLVLSAFAIGGPVGLVPAVAAPSVAAKTLAWSPCFPREGRFQCADLTVPLDYSRAERPDDRHRGHPAAGVGPARRIGSLLLNPGGPGGSGVDFVRFAGPFLFTDEVRARFDLVGFDPRGINRSRQLRCFQDPSQWAPIFTPFVFPSTAAEERQRKASDLYLVNACAAGAAPSSTTWRLRMSPVTWTSCAKHSATTS